MIPGQRPEEACQVSLLETNVHLAVQGPGRGNPLNCLHLAFLSQSFALIYF